VHRTLAGDRQQFVALGRGQGAGEREPRAQPVGALALVRVVAVDADLDALDRYALALGVPEDGQRLARRDGGVVQVVRRRAGVVAADRRQLVDGDGVRARVRRGACGRCGRGSR